MKVFNCDPDGIQYVSEKAPRKPLNEDAHKTIRIAVVSVSCAAGVIVITAMIGLVGLLISGGGLMFSWLIKEAINV